MPKMLKEMFGEMTAWGRFWLYLGLITLAVAAAMSFDFGWSISGKHAIFLMCLSAIAAFGPEAAYSQWVEGRKAISIILAAICLPLLGIEFYTHAGYTAGLRGTNIETATVQNTKYAGAQEAVTEDKTNLELWKKQLASLLEQDAWTATVKADGLRGELATIKDRIEAEKKGQRGRKAGCGKECEALQNQASDIEKRIAKVEQREDLAKRIEATQRILDGKRDTAAKTEFKSSAVSHQNEFLSKTLALFKDGSLKPTEIMNESAQQSVNLAMAFAGTGLPALALFIAGLYRVRQPRPRLETANDVGPSIVAMASTAMQPRKASIHKLTVHDLLNGSSMSAAH